MGSESVVLLRLEGTHVRVFFGTLRTVTARRIQVWFGHIEFGQKIWTFDGHGYPRPEDREFLGDCRLVSRAEFDTLSTFFDLVSFAKGEPVLCAEVHADPEPATLYRFV